MSNVDQSSPAPPQRKERNSGFSKGLSRNHAERQAHLDSMRVILDDPVNDRLHSWIHQNLTILDGKAQAIMGLYSIALAALTLYYASLAADAPLFVVGVVVVGFLAIAWSIIPLARVSYVYWSSTEEFREPDRLFVDLLRVRDDRTALIRRSVLKGIILLVVFAVLLAWDISRRIGGWA